MAMTSSSRNLGLEGYGIGWNTANSLAYQCTAAGIFADSIPDGSNNHVFACWAQFNGSGDFQQIKQSCQTMEPLCISSEKRLGRDVSAQCRVLERERNNVSNNPTYDVREDGGRGAQTSHHHADVDSRQRPVHGFCFSC